MIQISGPRKAFTLIELIIVIAIIVIMLAVSIPITANAIVERSLYNAAVQVQQDIRLAQQLAISHSNNGSHFIIRFYPAQNEYRIEADYDANYVTDSGKIITRKFNDAYGFPIYFGKDTPDSVTFGPSSAPGNTATVNLNFNNLGDPRQGGGHINLMNRSGTKQIQVVVSLIGRVRIEWVKH